MDKKVWSTILFFVLSLSLYIYYLATPTKSPRQTLTISKDIKKSTTDINDKDLKELNQTKISKEFQQIKDDLKDLQQSIDINISQTNTQKLIDQKKEQEAEDLIVEAERLTDRLSQESDINVSEIEKNIEDEEKQFQTIVVPQQSKDNLKETEKIIEKVIENYEELKE